MTEFSSRTFFRCLLLCSKESVWCCVQGKIRQNRMCQRHIRSRYRYTDRQTDAVKLVLSNFIKHVITQDTKYDTGFSSGAFFCKLIFLRKLDRSIDGRLVLLKFATTKKIRITQYASLSGKFFKCLYR